MKLNQGCCGNLRRRWLASSIDGCQLSATTKLSLGAAVLAIIMLGDPARGGIIYQSATLGNPAQGNDAALGGPIDQILGARFSISSPVQVSGIGGSIGGASGNVFGAIVSFSSPAALPPGDPFVGPEVVASTVFDPGLPASDFITPLSVRLAPGEYAVIFGSNHLGAGSGVGLMPTDNTDLPGASYIAFDTIPMGDWYNLPAGQNLYFVVTGSVVPEPSGIVLAGCCGAGMLALRRRKWRVD